MRGRSGMRRRQQRNNTFKRGYTLAASAVVLIGFLIGGWNTVAMRSDGPSAGDTVALRFPSEWSKALPAANLVAAMKRPLVTAAANLTRDAQLALFDPSPMVSPAGIPRTIAQVAQVPASPALVQVAAAESEPVTAYVNAPRPAAQPRPAPRPVTAARTAERRRVMNRPGYLLNDAQIASIKERLNLTSDQESMWPAVEAALRNMSYTHVKAPAATGGAPPDDTQVAAVDPDSVDNLKSAATPLILSFSDEQKDQVRDIAHVMGLDQLASQF